MRNPSYYSYSRRALNSTHTHARTQIARYEALFFPIRVLILVLRSGHVTRGDEKENAPDYGQSGKRGRIAQHQRPACVRTCVCLFLEISPDPFGIRVLQLIRPCRSRPKSVIDRVAFFLSITSQTARSFLAGVLLSRPLNYGERPPSCIARIDRIRCVASRGILSSLLPHFW